MSANPTIGLDALALTKLLSSISLSLCHTQELIGLAYQLSCEIHPADPPSAIQRVIGRLATLMHVSEQQLQGAQTQAQQLIATLQAS